LAALPCVAAKSNFDCAPQFLVSQRQLVWGMCVDVFRARSSEEFCTQHHSRISDSLFPPTAHFQSTQSPNRVANVMSAKRELVTSEPVDRSARRMYDVVSPRDSHFFERCNKARNWCYRPSAENKPPVRFKVVRLSKSQLPVASGRMRMQCACANNRALSRGGRRRHQRKSADDGPGFPKSFWFVACAR
jgi:hypothetical protein